MADISQYLQAILEAVYGEQVRGSIHDAIDIINRASEVSISAGTAVSGPSSSSTGFFVGSMYINTTTYDLWKCVGTDFWQRLGNIRGIGIASLEKTSTVGNVDYYTITFDDGETETFTVTNGINGTNGSIWYKGTALTGTGTSITGFPGVQNDFYLNSSTDALSANQGRVLKGLVDNKADTSSLATVATSGDYDDLVDKPTIPTIAVGHSGTASTTAVRKETITVNGTIHDVDGSVYMESTANAASFVFTNSDYILSTSAIDVYVDTWGDAPDTVAVDGAAHTCTVTFGAAKTRQVRIYIK